MFRFIELLGICILLYFIVNFLHYILYKLGSLEGKKSSNPFLGLSNGWIKAENNDNVSKKGGKK